MGEGVSEVDVDVGQVRVKANVGEGVSEVDIHVRVNE